MKHPPNHILNRHAPLDVWKQAERMALRSPLKSFRTGAVIVNGSDIISTGWSHHTFPASTHAEEHAIRRGWPKVVDATCLLVTISRIGNWCWSSRPCAKCALLMESSGVHDVVYAERCNDGSWAIRRELVADLANIARLTDTTKKFARNMRLTHVHVS